MLSHIRYNTKYKYINTLHNCTVNHTYVRYRWLNCDIEYIYNYNNNKIKSLCNNVNHCYTTTTHNHIQHLHHSSVSTKYNCYIDYDNHNRYNSTTSTSVSNDVMNRPQQVMLQHKPPLLTQQEINDTLNNIDVQYIRNFSIIAHIDHGKSTLSDRLLEYTNTINPLDKTTSRILDNLQVERDRGITVRAQSAAMLYKYNKDNKIYLFNLIDTPGHVDFSYEVSRSLAACDGVLLLVDSSQGLQAQTLANYYIAKENNLCIIPVLTKIDLPHSNIEGSKQQLVDTLGFKYDDILCISSKSGIGIEHILPTVIDRIQPPKSNQYNLLRALIFDAYVSTHRGVICLINISDGYIQKGDKIKSYYTDQSYEIYELGILQPNMKQVDVLRAGQVGYIVCGIKTAREIKIGVGIVISILYIIVTSCLFI